MSVRVTRGLSCWVSDPSQGNQPALTIEEQAICAIGVGPKNLVLSSARIPAQNAIIGDFSKVHHAVGPLGRTLRESYCRSHRNLRLGRGTFRSIMGFIRAGYKHKNNRIHSKRMLEDTITSTCGTICPMRWRGDSPLALLLLSCSSLPAQFTMFPAVRGTHEMIARANNFEVEAGYRMLTAGGNAVDAGVAAILAASIEQARLGWAAKCRS